MKLVTVNNFMVVAQEDFNKALQQVVFLDLGIPFNVKYIDIKILMISWKFVFPKNSL